MPSSVAHPEFFAFVLCNLLLVVSALMPWENFGIATASGLDVNRGWFVLIAALIAGGMAAWGAFQPNGLPFLRWVQLGSAFVGYAMPIIELSLIGDAKDCNNSNSLFSDCAFAPDAGIGVIVALLAANALAGIALIRNHTPRSYVLCSLLGPLGAGIEWLIRQNERRAASA
jgi:hypothetical protein